MLLKKIDITFIILILIIVLGGFLRFYKLDWGEGLFAHPDEYHIVISVNQLVFPTQMHPHFFNYGTVIIYFDFFTKEFFQKFNLNPFLIGRFYSAFFSTLTILSIYLICRFILDENRALIAAFLVAITPGLIQQAHFATPESALTFFIFQSLLLLLCFTKTKRLRYILCASIFLGFGIGTKIVAIFFLPVILMTILLVFLRSPVKLISFLLLSIATSTITLVIVNPFMFLDYRNWLQSFNYEKSLGDGSTLVFYTRQFIDTYPVLFQLEKILPFVLGVSLSIFSILGIIFISVVLIKKFSLRLFIIFFTFLCFFLPNSFFFAKWTRFIAPTFPFFAIFAIYPLQQLYKKSRFFSLLLLFILIISTATWSVAVFSIYLNHDVRITADNWIKSHLPANSTYLVEGANTVDLPLNGLNRTSLDFYNLDEDPIAVQKVVNALLQTDYFIIQSRRVFINHQRLQYLYPKTARLYDNLFNGKLGFEEIKIFHSFPSLSFMGLSVEFPDEKNAEETWSVFDHPLIRIFQKKQKLEQNEYEKIII